MRHLHDPVSGTVECLGLFVEELESAVSNNEKSAALELIEEYRKLVKRVEDVLSPATERGCARFDLSHWGRECSHSGS